MQKERGETRTHVFWLADVPVPVPELEGDADPDDPADDPESVSDESEARMSEGVTESESVLSAF